MKLGEKKYWKPEEYKDRPEQVIDRTSAIALTAFLLIITICAAGVFGPLQ